MMYDLKWLEEVGWGIAVTVAVFVLTALLGIESVTDWRTWALGIVTGSVRVAAAVALNELRKRLPATAQAIE